MLKSAVSRALARAARLIAAVAAGFAAGHAAAQSVEVQVSANADLIDPEFSQSRAQIIWVDAVGGIWVADLDRASGAIVPADGQGQLVDSHGIALGASPWAYNGPEWVLAASGDQVVYTRFLPLHRSVADNARIVVAHQRHDGSWATKTLKSDGGRYIPYGSETEGGRHPMVTYLDPRGNHYWRRLERNGEEQPLSVTTNLFVPLRPVRGADALIYPATINEVQQVFMFDLATGINSQLTTDPGDKISSWMWRAPEYGDTFVMASIVGSLLRFYRPTEGKDGTAQWLPVLETPAPPGYAIRSLEPFVHAGRSYLFMGMSVGSQSYSSEIWVANIDPAAPFLRRVSDASPTLVRSDPEVFITDNGPRIYFNRYSVTADPLPQPCYTRQCSHGVWMVDPGL